MRTILAFRRLAVFPVLALGLFPAFVPEAESAPRLSLKETAHDWGRINEGVVAEHVFTFTNDGDRTLVIDQVKTSCGCTGTVLSAKEIAPGKKGSLKVTFNSRNYSRDVTKTITVHSNDPAGPLSLELKAWVKKDLEVTPTTLYLRPGADGAYPVLDLLLVNVGEKPFKVLSAEPADEAVILRGWTGAAVLTPGDTLSLQVSYADVSGSSGGTKNTELQVKTTSSINGLLKIPLVIIPKSGKMGF
jgi:hypothetical protein